VADPVSVPLPGFDPARGDLVVVSIFEGGHAELMTVMATALVAAGHWAVIAQHARIQGTKLEMGDAAPAPRPLIEKPPVGLSRLLGK